MNNLVVDILKSYKKPLLIGSYPPPLGGVSVHIYRLLQSVTNAEVFDTSKGGGLKYFKLFFNLIVGGNDVVHLHVLTKKMFLIVLFARLFKRFQLMTTDHNTRLFSSRSNIDTALIKILLSYVDYPIVVGPQILEVYDRAGIKWIDKVLVCNSFLPPPLNDEAEIFKTYPSSYKVFVNNRSPVLVTNAYQLVLIDNKDIYGIDKCIELIERLKTEYQNIGLVIFIANNTANTAYYDELERKIDSKGVSDHILFVTGQKELWPAFKYSNLMLRPTLTDGFGISIAEAIHMECPAIASDVCTRAEGTVTFPVGDLDEFERVSRMVLKESYKPEMKVLCEE